MPEPLPSVEQLTQELHIAEDKAKQLSDQLQRQQMLISSLRWKIQIHVEQQLHHGKIQ